MILVTPIIFTIAAGWLAVLDHKDPQIRVCPVIIAFLAGTSWGYLLSLRFCY